MLDIEQIKVTTDNKIFVQSSKDYDLCVSWKREYGSNKDIQWTEINNLDIPIKLQEMIEAQGDLIGEPFTKLVNNNIIFGVIISCRIRKQNIYFKLS